MRKQPEAENVIKTIVRDQLALNPLVSVQKVQVALHKKGYYSSSGYFLDWHYISKLIKKVRLENISALSRETRMARLVAIKERHRVLTERLAWIAEGKTLAGLGNLIEPTARDMINAANAIMKWDTVMFSLEEQANLLDQDMVQEKRTITKAVIVTDMVETKSLPANQNRYVPEVRNEPFREVQLGKAI